MQNSEIYHRRNYLYTMHIFQQLRKRVELHQWDHPSAGGLLRLSFFIQCRNQSRKFQVAVFLRKKQKVKSKGVKIMINCLNTNNYVSPLTNSSKHNDNERKGKKHQAAQENVQSNQENDLQCTSE